MKKTLKNFMEGIGPVDAVTPKQLVAPDFTGGKIPRLLRDKGYENKMFRKLAPGYPSDWETKNKIKTTKGKMA